MTERAISWQAQHAPRGADAHFTLGMFGAGGGFGMAQARCATQDVFIGVRQGEQIRCLPFYREDTAPALETFNVIAGAPAMEMVPFASEEITRQMGWGTDSWTAPGLNFTIATPVTGVPNPATAPTGALQNALVPAIVARLTIDNRSGSETVQGIFAINQMRGLRMLAEETGGELIGVASIEGWGFAVEAGQSPNAIACGDFDLPSLFQRPQPLPWCLPLMGCLLFDVPAGETMSIDIAMGWYRPGVVTTGAHACSYWYTRLFPNLEAVLGHALANRAELWDEALAADAQLEGTTLNEDQRFCIAQATRCYWASSMLFDDGGRPRWAVIEGTYMMLNTFDLAVDLVFFELQQHPWIVRNLLDSFADEWTYRDTLHFPDDPDRQYPGGVSFCHDQGIYYTWTRDGRSSYEIGNQPGCFSHMTQEQLTNWIGCAALYVHRANDDEWLQRRRGLLGDCLQSMLNRDHPDPAQRDGIMDLDSSRCGREGEITTYDSLDASLGQARRNLYLAVKSWAAYVCLGWMLRRVGETALANDSDAAAKLAAKTIASAYDSALGYIPSILDGRDTSPIIPAVEGLVFPARIGLCDAVSPDGDYGEMIMALRQHIKNTVQPGRCLFPDGGWKLSANSDNSWISKIFLCQHIVRDVLGINFDKNDEIADRAHADWWRVGCPANPGIDQIIAGQRHDEVGFFYPRGISCALWLEETH